MTMKKLLLAGVAALLLATGAAHATDSDEELAERCMNGATFWCDLLDERKAAKQYKLTVGCFTRTYDRAHLARHPDQRVTAVKLHIYNSHDPNLAPVLFDAQFKLRGKSKLLRTSGLCNDVRCSVECDGGGVDIVPRASDLMMYLQSIRVTTCDNLENLIDGGQDLTGGKDDRVFRLNRVGVAACAGMSERK